MKYFRVVLIILFQLYLYADVTLKAPDTFIKGEPYFFEIEAVGNSVKFPEIKNIDGFIVENQGTSRSLQIINGNYDEKTSKRFMVVPTKDFTIPKFKFKIGDKVVYTNEKKVTQELVHKTNSNNFDLTLSASKKQLYVGEDLLVKLVFKYKKGLQITNLGFEKPHFENFWYKRVDSPNDRYEQNGYIVQELDFLLFPQKSGKLKVGPLKVDVQMVDDNINSNFTFFSSVPKLEKVYSNQLTFDVKQLPSGVNLVGDFDIDATIDKQDIKEGESVALKLNIKGIGNFDDIDDIKLDIPNATVYDNKPEIKTQYSKKGYEGTYLKVFSIIPTSSITINPIKISYFDKTLKKVITKETKSFHINVEQTKQKKVKLEKQKSKTTTVEKNVVVEQNIPTKQKLEYFIFGIIFTVLSFGLYRFLRSGKDSSKKEETPLNKLVKRTKNKDELIKVLLPYLKKDSKLDDLIFECEKDKEFKIVKKEILNRINEIKI